MTPRVTPECLSSKCDIGMSVENVPAVISMKTLKIRFIAHKFCTGWSLGVVKSVGKKKRVAT